MVVVDGGGWGVGFSSSFCFHIYSEFYHIFITNNYTSSKCFEQYIKHFEKIIFFNNLENVQIRTSKTK